MRRSRPKRPYYNVAREQWAVASMLLQRVLWKK